MNWLEMNEQRDSAGMLTPLAIALATISNEGCDCGTDESGSCIGCACEAALKDLTEKLEVSEAEVERLKAEMEEASEEISDTQTEAEHWASISRDYEIERDALKAEVERLKVTADNMADMAAAAADELDRYRAAAEMATIACASVWTEDFKRAFGVDRLRLLKTFADQLPGITEETRIEDYLCALLFPEESNRPRAHNWQQERAAVVKWLLSGVEPKDVYGDVDLSVAADDIERGEHWPEGGQG